MSKEEILELVKAHTKYSVKCECGEYLLKRENGLMSERDAWELHFAQVLNDRLNPVLTKPPKRPEGSDPRSGTPIRSLYETPTWREIFQGYKERFKR